MKGNLLLSIRKEIISRLIEPLSDCCISAVICAALKAIGFMRYTGNSAAVEFKSSSPEVLRALMPVLKKEFGQSELSYRKKLGFQKNNLYFLEMKVSEAVSIKKFIEEKSYGQCCMKTFVSVMFLLSGSVSINPYTLEFFHEDRALLKKLHKMLDTAGNGLKIYRLKRQYVLLGRGKESVVRFIDYLKLNSAILELENQNIIMEYRNLTNRLVNCETGNLKKIVSSSEKQLAYILILEEKIGFDNVTQRIREAAMMRKENPDASLSELAMISEGKFTKSALNHCFREIKKMSENVF